MKHLIRLTLLTLALTSWAADARADGWISPFAGVNFGGDAGGEFDNLTDDRNHLTWGFDAGWMGSGIFGVELDFAYTKDFFGKGESFGDNSVVTILPTLIVGIPIGGQTGGGVRPYVSAGVGWLKREFSQNGVDVFEDPDTAAFTFGGGVMAFFADHVGVRGDYRYIRGFSADELSDVIDVILDKDDPFSYSRATLGVIFRF